MNNLFLILGKLTQFRHLNFNVLCRFSIVMLEHFFSNVINFLFLNYDISDVLMVLIDCPHFFNLIVE